jgi:hypothetical protein
MFYLLLLINPLNFYMGFLDGMASVEGNLCALPWCMHQGKTLFVVHADSVLEDVTSVGGRHGYERLAALIAFKSVSETFGQLRADFKTAFYI